MTRYQALLNSTRLEDSLERDHLNWSLKQDISFYLGYYVCIITVDLLFSGPAATGVQSVIITHSYSLQNQKGYSQIIAYPKQMPSYDRRGVPSYTNRHTGNRDIHAAT